MGYWRLLKHNRRKWVALTHKERVLLIQAFLLLPVVRISRWMRFFRFQRIMGGVKLRSSQIANCNASALETARRVARMVSVAAAHSLFQSSCLDRSFLLWALLRRRGIDTDLFLGVRRDQENFEAHAWVEINGVVLNDTDDVRERFAPFSVPITAAGQLSLSRGRACMI
jgi:hypothetical protein